jgi:hypothetical protein
MAKETVTRLLDDLDGGVAHETVKFALDGHSYEIDLSSKNAKKAAQRPRGVRRSREPSVQPRGRRSKSSGASRRRIGQGPEPGHPGVGARQHSTAQAVANESTPSSAARRILLTRRQRRQFWVPGGPSCVAIPRCHGQGRNAAIPAWAEEQGRPTRPARTHRRRGQSRLRRQRQGGTLRRRRRGAGR